MLTKNITFTETSYGALDLKTHARKFITAYAKKKYSLFFDNTHTHKGLWRNQQGMYISGFRAKEQSHEAIAEWLFGKENKQGWSGVTIKITTLKDNQKILQVHSYTEENQPGTTPGIPKAQEKKFINDVIVTFDNIPSLNSIRIGIGETYFEYNCLSKTMAPITLTEFRKKTI